MESPDGSQVQVHLMRERIDVLRSLVLVQQRLVLIALLVASVIVPLTAIIEYPDDDEPAADAMGLFGSLGYFFEHDAEAFGDRETYPFAVDAGLTMTRIGLVLLLVTIACAVLAVVILWTSQGRGPRRTLITLAVGVIIAVAITFFGLSVLPDSADATTVTLWLLLPVGAAAGIFYHLWSLRALE